MVNLITPFFLPSRPTELKSPIRSICGGCVQSCKRSRKLASWCGTNFHQDIKKKQKNKHTCVQNTPAARSSHSKSDQW